MPIKRNEATPEPGATDCVLLPTTFLDRWIAALEKADPDLDALLHLMQAVRDRGARARVTFEKPSGG